VLLKHVPDWRWQMEREDCPWYPSLRLLRQSARRGWPDLGARAAAELRRLVEERA